MNKKIFNDTLINFNYINRIPCNKLFIVFKDVRSETIFKEDFIEKSFESDQTKPLVINLTHSFAQLKVIQFLYSLITILCFYYFIILPA
ncbi:MAG: hypothetical protein ACTSRZ_19165, partial [Promethearchaeota archaeon]